MANTTYLSGAPPLERVRRHAATGAALNPGEPELEARYAVPLFWLACFTAADQIPVAADDGDADSERWIDVCAGASAAIARFDARRPALAALPPPSFAPVFDAWTGFLAANYRACIHVRMRDFFAMDDYEVSETSLARAFAVLARADAGSAISGFEGLAYIVGISDLTALQSVGAGESLEEATHRHNVLLAGWHAQGAWPPPSGRLGPVKS